MRAKIECFFLDRFWVFLANFTVVSVVRIGARQN